MPDCPAPATAEWRHYPFTLVPDDPQFSFPAAEGNQDVASDTYYAAGVLEGESGNRYAFLTIFAKLGSAVGVGDLLHMNFHVFSLFDLQGGRYLTSSSFDVPGDRDDLNVARGKLEVDYVNGVRRGASKVSHMHARRAGDGTLIPFAYELDLNASDILSGMEMRLNLCVDALKPPQAVGGPARNGRIRVMGQDGTGSYYQSLGCRGTLRWGEVEETVSSPVAGCGWLDRQWFPQYVGKYAGLVGQDFGHQWLQLALDNGWEFSLWRHFDRRENYAVVDFSGLTATDPDGRTNFFDASGQQPEVEVDVLTYFRDPGSSDPLIRNVLSEYRYLFDACRIRVPLLGLDVVSRPLVAAPGHRLPVYYFSGPIGLQGTMGSQAVAGYGFHERTLILWRPWQLLDVLCGSLRHLPDVALAGSGTTPAQLADLAARAEPFLHLAFHYRRARAYLTTEVQPMLELIGPDHRPRITRILDDLLDKITIGRQ